MEIITNTTNQNTTISKSRATHLPLSAATLNDAGATMQPATKSSLASSFDETSTIPTRNNKKVLRNYKPRTPSTRQKVTVDRNALGIYKGRPVKSLTIKLKSHAGRDNLGHITVKRRLAGAKRLYRIIDFKRTRDNEVAVVRKIEYDPYRTCFIALIEYPDKSLAYILAPVKLSIGDEITSGIKVDPKPGNCMELGNIPTGLMVHNIEFAPGQGGKIERAAGAGARLVGRDGADIIVRLSSGETRKLHAKCRATVGVLTNPDHKNTVLGKAGATFHQKRKRSRSSPEKMNPVDHTLGGRTRGSKQAMSAAGIKAKGYKTRPVRKSNKFIISRKNK